jgi:hypothetical protein
MNKLDGAEQLQRLQGQGRQFVKPYYLTTIVFGFIGCTLWLSGCRIITLGQSSPQPSATPSPVAIAPSPQPPSASPRPIAGEPPQNAPGRPQVPPEAKPIPPLSDQNPPTQPTEPPAKDNANNANGSAGDSADSTTLSNGNWTITIGNLQSWSGVNNTGNLTYYGCDRENQCLRLTGGTMTCREGLCSSDWTNGDYRYIIRSSMSESGNEPSELIVQQGDRTLLHETGLR